MSNANYKVIADLLIQLGTAMKNEGFKVEDIVETKLDSTNTNNKYLTRKEVLEMYSPVITDYGLRQAIAIDGSNKKFSKICIVGGRNDLWKRRT